MVFKISNNRYTVLRTTINNKILKINIAKGIFGRTLNKYAVLILWQI